MIYACDLSVCTRITTRTYIHIHTPTHTLYRSKHSTSFSEENTFYSKRTHSTAREHSTSFSLLIYIGTPQMHAYICPVFVCVCVYCTHVGYARARAHTHTHTHTRRMYMAGATQGEGCRMYRSIYPSIYLCVCVLTCLCGLCLCSHVSVCLCVCVCVCCVVLCVCRHDSRRRRS